MKAITPVRIVVEPEAEVICTYCRKHHLVELYPDLPTNAMPLWTCDCGKTNQFTVGSGLALLLARVRLWVRTWPDVLLPLIGIPLLAGFFMLTGLFGAAAMLVCGLSGRQAMKDANYAMVGVFGGLALAVFAPVVGVPVLLGVIGGFVAAWHRAPEADWTPPQQEPVINDQHPQGRKARLHDVPDLL